jgi:hypothetical protein
MKRPASFWAKLIITIATVVASAFGIDLMM